MKGLIQYLAKFGDTFIKLFVIFVGISIALLGYFGYLEYTIAFLNSNTMTFSLGSIKFSIYQLLQNLFFIIILLWVANVFSEKGKKYFLRLRRIRASNKALVINFYQIFIYFITFMVAMNILNVKLSSLAFFGGAIGIGLGFGLQKITSNFISGLILLFEKSVEAGDLIETENGIYGFIRNTGARYTLVETFDGKEIMIPNEEFITKNVTNWTYSNHQGRVDVKIGVSYKCDIEKARELILEAAREHEKCSKTPEPNCYLREYGDSSVNFLLHFWVDDVTGGRYEPQSDVMRAIWRKFKEHNIEIPFPQRDVHIINDNNPKE